MQAGAAFFSCFGALRLSAAFLRKQCAILAEGGYGGVGDLIKLPLGELFDWIGAWNEVWEERRDRRGK